MFFGVFDFTFVAWLILGAVSVLVVAGAKTWFEDRAVILTWWKWLILGVWYVFAMLGLAAPFTLMGEGEVGAGGKMLLFTIPLLVISGVAIYRVMMIKASKQKA